MTKPPSEEPGNPDPSPEQQDELDRLTRIGAAAEAFSVWSSTDTAETPEVSLSSWRLMRLASGALHLVGTNDTEGGTGRVSSRLIETHAANRTVSTSSGRVYRLVGSPGRTQDSDYVWTRWLRQMGSPLWTDVTEELQREIDSSLTAQGCPRVAQLVNAHAGLFKGSAPRVSSFVPEGWLSLIDKLCSELTEALGDTVEDFSVAQIKEKFGGLRLYYDWPSADAHPELLKQLRGLINAASEASKQTCEKCGRPGEVRQVGFSATALCNDHFEASLKLLHEHEAAIRQKSVSRSASRASQVLYLDFDGVLHPEDARMGKRGPYVHSPTGHTLFEHAELLAELLEPYPNLKIVLSTTWAQPSFERARKRLPVSLAERCIGGTFHSSMDRMTWRQMSRGAQVLAEVRRRQPTAWLALDDNDEGWGLNLEHIVITDPIKGISEPAALAQLIERLQRFT